MLRDKFRESLNSINNVDQLMKDNNASYIIWLETIIADLRNEKSCPLYINYKKSCQALKDREKELDL